MNGWKEKKFRKRCLLVEVRIFRLKVKNVMKNLKKVFIRRKEKKFIWKEGIGIELGKIEGKERRNIIFDIEIGEMLKRIDKIKKNIEMKS